MDRRCVVKNRLSGSCLTRMNVRDDRDIRSIFERKVCWDVFFVLGVFSE